MTEYETMTYHRQSRIGYIALNRPQALNAVNDQFELDIAEALLEFDMDEEAWVGIIHGEGRAFCAGADIKQRFVEMTPPPERPAQPGHQRRRLPGPHHQLEACYRRRPRLLPGRRPLPGRRVRPDRCLGGSPVRHHRDQTGPARGQGLGQVQRLHALKSPVGDGHHRRTCSGGRALPSGAGQPPGPHRPAPGGGPGIGGEGAGGAATGLPLGRPPHPPPVGNGPLRRRPVPPTPATAQNRGLPGVGAGVCGEAKAGVQGEVGGVKTILVTCLTKRFGYQVCESSSQGLSNRCRNSILTLLACPGIVSFSITSSTCYR